MPLYTSVVIIFFFLNIGQGPKTEAIKCYKCFPGSSITPCNDEIGIEYECHGVGRGNRCLKMTGSNGKLLEKRCGEENTVLGCKNVTEPGGSKSEVCICNTDLCNNAPVFGICIYVILFTFCIHFAVAKIY